MDRDLILEGIREHLPGSVTVEEMIRPSKGFHVHFYDAKRNIAMDEELDRSEIWRLTESDKKGMDAMGLHGMDGMLMHVAMALGGCREDRIPPPVSGRRLTSEGRRLCEMLAKRFLTDADACSSCRK